MVLDKNLSASEKGGLKVDVRSPKSREGQPLMLI
jgi:hypothetical protein